MFSSITIGDGGDYDTIPLWQQARLNNIVDNKVNDELTLLSGTYNHTGSVFWYWPGNEGFSASIIIQAHPSALHNGDWDSGVCISGSTDWWKVQRNDLNITYRDIVLKKAKVKIDQTNNYFGSIFGVGWDMSAVHHCKLTFDRCMIYTEGTHHTEPDYYSYTPSSNPSAFGTVEVNYNNCVLEDTIGAVYPSNGTIRPGYTNTYGDHTYNFKGCTLIKQAFRSAQSITNLGTSASLTVNVSGCIEDTSGTGTGPGTPAGGRPTLIGGHPMNLGYYPESTGFPSNLSATLTDHITNQASGNVYDWATTKTNVSYAVPFTFDGTVTSGEVGFVDNQGASSFRDYRLVADLDNLPVKYMTIGELSYKDITGYKRPGGTDQRDAGAFQSISDQVLINKIGTSSVDFPAEYASIALWDSNEFTPMSVLNGTTHVLQLKNGEKHNHSTNIKMNYHGAGGDRNVNQSFILSGQNPHNGEWEGAAELDIDIFHTLTLYPGQNSFDFTYKDLVINSSSTVHASKRLLDIQPTHSRDYNLVGSWAPVHTYTYENFMVRYPLSSTTFLLLGDQNYERITDNDLNIIERGESRSIHKNCLYIGDTPGGTNYLGSIALFTHQYGTQASAVFDLQGCTLINSYINDGRHSVQANNLKLSAVGCLYYASPNHLDQFGNQVALLGPYSIGASYPAETTIAANNVKVFDSIFNNGAGNSIAAPSYQDRYGTWVIEPLPSEYNDSTSSTAEFYEPWNIWASSLNGTSFRVPFNFDGSVSAGTTSFISSATQDYRLVADQDNLAVQYMDVANASNYDLAGRRRPGLTDAGAFQSHSDAILSSIIGSGVDEVSADHATVALFYAASGDSIVNGQTFDLVFQNQEHDFIVNIGTNPLLEVDQKWIVRGDVSHGGKWDNGARFIETGLLTNQQWWGRVFDRLGKQDVIFEMKDIVLSSNFFHNNWGWFNAARAIEDAAHDCTYTFDRCLISIIRDLGWPYPNLVAYNSGTGEQGLTTVNILNTVVSGNTTPGSRNSLIQPYFTQNPGASHGGKGNTAHNFVGSTFYNRRGGHITLQNNDCNISGCIIVSRGSNAERFLSNTASNRNLSIVDNLFSNSQSYEEYSLGTDHTNCTFDVDYYFDNKALDGAVTFIGSALDPSGPLDFRLGGDPRVRTNLAEDYVTNAVLSNRDAASRLRDLGSAAAGAFEYNPELLKAIILDAIPKYTIGYRININR